MPKLSAITTYPHQNLCGFYAVANVIASKSEDVRKQAYENMGLSEEVVQELLFSQILAFKDHHDKVSKEMEELRVDDNSACIEIAHRFGSNIEVLRTFKNLMSDPTQKERLLDEHSDYLFKQEMSSGGDGSPYTFKQFKQLMDIYSEFERAGGGLLEALDKAVPFEKDKNPPQDFLQMGNSIDVYQPNGFPVLLGEFIKTKWIEEWAEASSAKFKQDLGADVSDSLIIDLGIGAKDNISLNSVKYIVHEVMPNSKNCISEALGLASGDPRDVNILLRHEHFTSFADDSEITKRLGEAEIELPKATGGESMHQQSGALKLYDNNALKLFCLDLLGDKSVIDAIKSGTKESPNVKKGVSFYQGDQGDLCISIGGNELILNRQTINIDPSMTNTADLRSKVISAFVESKNDIKSRATLQPSSEVAPQDSQVAGASGKDR